MLHAPCAPSRTFYLCPITSRCISDQVTKCSDKIFRSHDVFRTTYEMSDLIRIRIGCEGATDSSSIIRLVHFMPQFRHKNKYKISTNKNINDSFNVSNCCAFSSFFSYIFDRFPFSLISWGQHETRWEQQPRELCLLFVPTILFPCTQDCDRGAPSLSFSLSRNWVLLERTVTFYVILYVAIIFLLIFCSWHFPRLICSMLLVY